MYNLLVGFPEDRVWGSRIGEYTDEALREFVMPNRRLDPSRVLRLPTIWMPETQDTSVPQVAHIGALEHITPDGKDDWRVSFVSDYTVHTSVIENFAADLDIATWEFSRTHWAVKNVDLYRTLPDELFSHEVPLELLDAEAPEEMRLEPQVVPPRGKWAIDDRPREHDLVAVMMPFAREFDPVYRALSKAATAAGLRCQRADDIWHHDRIIDDIVSLIWRAEVVIADFTGRNPNVFYEIGVAHAFGRQVVPVSQSLGDVPFDLLAERVPSYDNTAEGLRELQALITGRLETIVGSQEVSA